VAPVGNASVGAQQATPVRFNDLPDPIWSDWAVAKAGTPGSVMRKNSTNDDVLSTREAAEKLGVALRTVQLWVESGVLPAWKTAGGHRRISRVAVERLIGERKAALSGDTRPASLATTGEARLRVMVVEDEPELLRLFTMVIAGWDLPIDVTPASDGFEALLRMGQQCPDLLVTDLNMPGMDGFKMIESLRGVGPAYDEMEIIVVTALSEAEIAQRGGLPGQVRVLHKPVPFDELEALVRDRVAALASAA
jgi:excisionase family DNA binding protein